MESEVAGFFADRVVLVTGATGFLGKAVVEKLLRSCPNVDRVFLILRAKGRLGVKERMEKLLANSVFDILRSQNPSVLRKMVPISGDVEMASLGLSVEDEALLIDSVSVVIHCAASVKFDEELGKALNTNVLGTLRLVKLAKRMRKLKALIHVSTAYANSDLPEVEERLYPFPLSQERQDILGRVERGEVLDLSAAQVTALLGNKPNTYTFSKAWVEQLLQEEAQGLPLSIVRPSIVAAAWREPVPGWVDNLLGASAVVAAASTGLLRSALIHKEKRIDLIPVDILVNLILTMAWARATAHGDHNKIPVFNCSTGTTAPVTFDQMRWLLREHMSAVPVMSRFPWVFYWKSEWVHGLMDLLLHQLPLRLMDAVALLKGEKPRMMGIYGRMKSTMQVLRFFTTNEWDFVTENAQKLRRNGMGETDARLFNFDTKQINWSEYFLHYHLGICKFVFGKDPAPLLKDKSHRG